MARKRKARPASDGYRGRASRSGPPLPRPKRKTRNPRRHKRFRIPWRLRVRLSNPPCYFCHQPVEPGDEASWHHIVFKSNGGRNGESNEVLTHAGCHREFHRLNEQTPDGRIVPRG